MVQRYKDNNCLQNPYKIRFLDIYQQTMPEQKQAIDQTITVWQGKEVQIDDILVMGFRL
jgi:hypothetical protein